MGFSRYEIGLTIRVIPSRIFVSHRDNSVRRVFVFVDVANFAIRIRIGSDWAPTRWNHIENGPTHELGDSEPVDRTRPKWIGSNHGQTEQVLPNWVNWGRAYQYQISRVNPIGYKLGQPNTSDMGFRTRPEDDVSLLGLTLSGDIY